MKNFERPPYFEAMVEFMADPTDQRTIKQFAADVGVHEDTIHAFKRKHSDVLYQAVEIARAQMIPKMRIQSWKAVFANINKNHLDRKLALQLTGDLIERSEVQQTIKPEEKRERAKALLAQLSERFTDKPIDNK